MTTTLTFNRARISRTIHKAFEIFEICFWVVFLGAIAYAVISNGRTDTALLTTKPQTAAMSPTPHTSTDAILTVTLPEGTDTYALQPAVTLN